jgi:hypothetical protein
MNNKKDDRDALSHPMQPVGFDPHGVARFKPNAIVEFLLEHGGFDMNDLGVRGFSAEDQMQFAQLIGYSASGYCSLSYVSEESKDAADAAAEQLLKKRG